MSDNQADVPAQAATQLAFKDVPSCYHIVTKIMQYATRSNGDRDYFDNQALNAILDLGNCYTLLAKEIHNIAVDHGFYDGYTPDAKRNFGEVIALVHSELSEAFDAASNNNPPDDELPTHDSVSVELADALIRILDTCHYENIDIIAGLRSALNDMLARGAQRIKYTDSWGAALAYAHSTVSLALEAHRKAVDSATIAWAISTAILTIMYVGNLQAHNVPEAMLAKIEYNRSRPYKHGKQY